PTFTNLESFTPVNVLDNALSYEHKVHDYDYGCENYDKKPRSLVSVQEGDPTMLEQVDAKRKKNKSKNVQGQPSKNLMAERRRSLYGGIGYAQYDGGGTRSGGGVSCSGTVYSGGGCSENSW
nr:hypothetical protein [Tanacetum cinerariifolium]